MGDLINRVARIMHAEKHPTCPHCHDAIDFEDPEFAQPFTSYWGDVYQRQTECPNCRGPISVTEHVRRSWSVESAT